MAIVKCTLLGASQLIDDVVFSGEQGAMVSEEITDELAAQFARVPGFELIEAGVVDAVDQDKPPVKQKKP